MVEVGIVKCIQMFSEPVGIVSRNDTSLVKTQKSYQCLDSKKPKISFILRVPRSRIRNHEP